MTTAVYVTSTQTFSGKSALCVGLLRRFQRDGLKVGYMKPVSTMARMAGGRVIDEDAHFMKYTLDLADSPDLMAPVLLNDQQVAAVLAGDKPEYEEKIRSAYNTIASGKDVVVLEGGANLREGWVVNLPPVHVADLLEIGELVVTPYEDNLQVVDDLLTARMRHGDSLLGAVINQTPQDRLEYISDHIKPFLEERGIPIFACLPKERFLLSASIADLADGLGGEILSSHHAVDRLVEHLMVGAMDVDQAFNHFHQTTNKAVITGGDRTDIQLSALETSARCLILTGNLTPRPMIVERAEAMDVPIILTPHDTLTAVEIVEHFFGRSRFHQEEKVQYFDNMLGKHMDFEALYRALNLQLPGGSR